MKGFIATNRTERLAPAHAEKFEALIEKHGARAVAKMLGCDHTTVDRLRDGGGAGPATVKRIAAVLDRLEEST